MHETDLARIEAALSITLPFEFREMMLARGNDLKEISQRHDSLDATLFVDPDRFVLENQTEREPDMGTAHAFPEWWKKFVLVGTKGGGDYYCLRLDGDPRVWMIGSDCGAKPKKIFDSFSDLIDNTIQSQEHPDPLPSSFDDSCPLPLRFQISLATDWDGHWGFCKVRPLEGDRPLTQDKLQSHGILPADLKTCSGSIVAALANASPETIKFSDRPPATSFADQGEYLVGGFLKPSLADARFDSVTVKILQESIYVEFRLKEERAERAPAAKHLKVDWKRFQDGVVRFLRVLHPPGTRVTITSPKPESASAEPRYEWSYELSYTLTPR